MNKNFFIKKYFNNGIATIICSITISNCNSSLNEHNGNTGFSKKNESSNKNNNYNSPGNTNNPYKSTINNNNNDSEKFDINSNFLIKDKKLENLYKSLVFNINKIDDDIITPLNKENSHISRQIVDNSSTLLEKLKEENKESQSIVEKKENKKNVISIRLNIENYNDIKCICKECLNKKNENCSCTFMTFTACNECIKIKELESSNTYIYISDFQKFKEQVNSYNSKVNSICFSTAIDCLLDSSIYSCINLISTSTLDDFKNKYVNKEYYSSINREHTTKLFQLHYMMNIYDTLIKYKSEEEIKEFFTKQKQASDIRVTILHSIIFGGNKIQNEVSKKIHYSNEYLNSISLIPLHLKSTSVMQISKDELNFLELYNPFFARLKKDSISKYLKDTKEVFPIENENLLNFFELLNIPKKNH